mgnify:CR=1 FL=1
MKGASDLTPGERLWATIKYHDRWSVRALGRLAHVAWGTFRDPAKIADDDPYWTQQVAAWRDRLGCRLADASTHRCLRIYVRSCGRPARTDRPPIG